MPPVARADSQLSPAAAEFRADVASILVRLHRPRLGHIDPDRSVTGRRVQVCREVPRQLELDPAVPGPEAPILFHRGAILDSERDVSVAKVQFKGLF